MEIKIENLRKSYDQTMVLSIERLEIPTGQITAIVGPNGAGKSTLLHLIAGLLEKDSGSIFYNGQTETPYRKMTLVFQEPYLITASVRANIEYGLKIRKETETVIQKRVEAIAEKLKLETLLDKKAGHLSLGETQKVALARALVFEPELLMLDEPSASMDPYMTSEVEKLLLEMNREKKRTVLIVTHNLAQAKRLADHVVLLNRGMLVESGDAENFFKHPQDLRTKKFIEGELLI